MDILANRYQAGKRLAQKLQTYAHQPNTLVLALPRGGVPVGYALAKYLHLPLDILIVRKLGVPWHPELAFGAISYEGKTVFNDVIAQSIPQHLKEEIIQKEHKELQRRLLTYRGDIPFPFLTAKTIILVDDGIATGASIRAAILWLTQQKPQNIILAVPVLPAELIEPLNQQVNQLVYLLAPEQFEAVGQWYDDFSQTDDQEVISLLQDRT